MSKLLEKHLPSSSTGMLILASVVGIITVLAVFIVGDVFELTPAELYELYFINLRSNFFTGFLTVGSFMLSLKTFIVVKLKESVFDSESYRIMFQEQAHHFADKNEAYYRPLKNLSKLLFLTITSSVITAIVQVTFGMFSSMISFIICVFTVAFSFVMVLLSLYLIHSNIYSWLETSKEPKSTGQQK